MSFGRKNSKLNFAPLRKVMDKIDDNGEHGRCGNWEMALGGYDHGYEIYYRGAPIGRVNYELKEYELYDEDFILKDQIQEFLSAIDARKFKDVGYHEDEDDDIDDDDQRYVQESIGNLETFLSEKEREFEPSGVNPSWDESEDKVWAVQDYLSSMGSFTDEDREYLRQTAPELLSLEEEDIVNESMLPLKDITKRYSAKQRTALDGKSWWVGFDNETGKYIPDYRYKTKGECETGIIVDMKHGRLDATPDELNKIEVAFGGMKTESKRKQKMKFKKIVGESRDWEKHEDSKDFKLEIRNRKELDELYGIIYHASLKFDDAEKWLDKLDDFYADGGNGWELELKGKKELDTFYSLVRAGALSSDDKTAIKFRNRLSKFYAELQSNGGVVEEAGEADSSDGDTPKIYVGTYAKYNDGSIDGKWIDLTKYDTYEDFVQACQELHADEEDPEFMVQDYENFPEKWYHEGGLPTEEEFDKINEYYLMDDSEKDAYAAYVSYTDNDSIEDFHEAYQGQFDSAEDFAYHIVDSMGWDSLGQENLDMYFDYDSFGRDLMYDFHIGDPDNTDSEGEPEDPDHYYDNDGYDQGEYESDRQVAEDYVDSLGGVDQLGPDTARNYFDYDSFGRDLFINDYFEEDGYVFSRY